MYQQTIKKRSTLLFKHFTHKGYAVFCSLGKEVLICTLSLTTLTHAKADSISVRELPADTTQTREVALDEVTISAGARTPLTDLQSAKIVSVISADDIKRAEATSINDVLKLGTGVDVRQRGGFGVQTDISINGGTFDQITILLNGINLSNPQTGHNVADFPVSLSDIERIEVLEGASARIIGSSAFSGAINIVTRQREASHIRTSVEAGSYGTLSGDVGATFTGQRLCQTLSGGYTRSDGGMDNSDFNKWRMYYSGQYTSSHLDLTWQVGTSSQQFGAGTFYTPKYNNQYEETRRYLASLSANIRPTGSQRLVLRPTLYWHRDYDHYQLTRGKEGAGAGENFHRADIYGIGMNAYLTWALGKTSVGVDIRKEHLLSTAYGEELSENEWEDIKGSDRQYNRRGIRTNTDFFVEHNVVIDKLTVSAGMLANCNTGLNGNYRFYPGIDVSYRPTEHWKLHASWNKGLRVPTYTDIYIDSPTQQGDKNLKPERNSTFRLGSQYRNTGVTASVSAFVSQGRDMIDWVYETEESTRYHALNIGKINNMGLSTDVNINLCKLLTHPVVERINMGYAYICQHHETNQPIFRSLYALEYLRHKLVAQIDHRIYHKLTAAWTLRWQQRMNGYHPYAKLDAKLMWTDSRYNLYLKADNLTSHRYYDLGGVLQPGLWMMVGCSIKIGL